MTRCKNKDAVVITPLYAQKCGSKKSKKRTSRTIDGKRPISVTNSE